MSRTMKAAVLQRPGQFTVEQVPIPEIGSNDVLVKVIYASICGSDLRMFSHGIHVQKFPQIIGHEFSGVIVEKGENVQDVEIGDRMMGLNLKACGECWWCKHGQGCPLGQALYGLGYSEYGGGCFAEYLALRGSELNMGIWKLPDAINDQAGALCEPFCVAPGNIDVAGGIEKGERVLVIGAGIIGNSMAQYCKNLGADVLLTDICENRLKYARDLGIDTANTSSTSAMQAVIERWGGGPYPYHLSNDASGMADIVFDCAGAPSTLSDAIDSVRWKGRVVMSAACDKDTLINPQKLMMKNIKLVSGTAGNFAKAIDAIANSSVQPMPLISHVFPLDDVQKAFEVAGDPGISMKVQLKIS